MSLSVAITSKQDKKVYLTSLPASANFNSPTIEGDTTNFYIYKKLHSSSIPVTTIARGISVGDELEHTDEVTLGRSIVNRTPYENTIQKKNP